MIIILISMYNDFIIPKSATPFKIKGNNNLIIFIHGIQDYPGEFDKTAEQLNSKTGYSVFVPRLAGHGTTESDLNNTSCDDWVKSVEEYLINIRYKFDKIILAGHSMGCLIALDIASRYRIKNLILISPALDTYNKLIYLTPILRFFLNKIKEKGTHKARFEEEKRIEEIYWNWTYIKPSYQLLKLMRRSRKLLKKIDSRILVFISEKDRTVPMKVIDFLEKRSKSKNIEKVILKECRHIFTRSSDLDLITDRVAQWINR